MCYIFLTANWGVTWMYFSSFVPRPLQFFPTSAEDLTIKARFFQIVLNNYTSCNLFFSLQSWNRFMKWWNWTTKKDVVGSRLPPKLTCDGLEHLLLCSSCHMAGRARLFQKICFLLCAGMQEYQELWLVSPRWLREVGVFFGTVRVISVADKMRNWSAWKTD